MSAVPQAIPQPARQFMRVNIKGRIDAVRRHEGFRFTRMTTPAPDAYTKPAVVEVRSREALGQVGDEVSVVCDLGGYPRKPYKVTDANTGEIRTITPVEHTLNLVE
jgi:hypothetical protein